MTRFKTKMHALIGGAAAALAMKFDRNARKIYGAENIRRYIQTYGHTKQHWSGGSLAQGNRHGDEHRHLRERARRLYKPGPERRAYLSANSSR